ncbi:hypothetical protein GCM10010413_50640 [Promicromonospora sukumoe]|uniref:Glycosyltransferase 2-like domain-containing protein n=1 Tax=Promicromonospora sukumoe TaxID=88382 RepID=A0A7W3PC59_9MICO|nr:glycosyltransferase family A protein [Promicromonospora sukumoe]MBA8806306.1 hypothetical protein [Promicromonospora sukumoe]
MSGPGIVVAVAIAAFIGLTFVGVSSGAYGDVFLGALVLSAILVGVLNRRVLWAVRGEQRQQSSRINAINSRTSDTKQLVAKVQPVKPTLAGGEIEKVRKIGADNEYARRVGLSGAGMIETYALQNRSEAARDVLARAASNGRYDAARLIILIKTLQRDHKSKAARDFFGTLEVRPLLSLAKVMAQQNFHSSDQYDAVMVYKAVVGRHGGTVFHRADRLVFLELLASMRWVKDVEKYARLLKIDRFDPVQRHLLRADAVNPFRDGTEDDSDPVVQTWLESVNAAFDVDGVEHIGIAPGIGAAIDRISCVPAYPVEDGPLVTVIMPTYAPDERIRTALASVLGQSYRNLQVLLMDDASPSESAAYLDTLAAQDPRVTVVHLPENRGTYKARNIAVTEYATGEFVTVHDDDDWSHPRKVELQVKHLQENPDEPANLSLLSRATPELQFVRINNNALFSQPNYSSLMFRRTVFDELGFWDVANRSADAEMHDRVRSFTGRPMPVVGTSPLSFLRVRAESLTSGEINKGYFDTRRMWYQRIYRAWHEARLESGQPMYVGPDVRGDRPFAAPAGLLGAKSSTDVLTVDVVYATDFRFPGGNSSLSAREVTALVERGYRVALLQLDSPLLSAMNVLHKEFVDLAEHDNVHLVSTLDAVEADLTIVRHPTVLQYIRPDQSRISTQNLVVIFNHPPFESDLTGAVYDVSDVLNNAESVFGVAPRVAPESGLLRSLLRGAVDPSRFLPDDWNGIVEVGHGTVRSVDEKRRPVIGRHSRDHIQKWPAASVLNTVYPQDGSRDVRVLGGAFFAEQRLGGPVKGWTVYPFGAKPAQEFLDEVDFWVYFHGDEWYESFGMAIAEAMASGLVVILPKYMKATFGEGALYCEPDQALRLVDSFWSDPEAYAAQSKKALEYSRAHFGEDALMERVGSHLSGRQPVDLGA